MIIISEPSFTVSNWYNDILSGLKSQARKRRENVIECKNVNELTKIDGTCVCLIGSNFTWLNDAINKVLQTNNYPIVLGNNGQLSFDGKCSSVSADIALSVRKILKMFENDEKNNVALYGISNDSLSDVYKANVFSNYHPKNNIIYNNGSFSNCFSDFYERHSRKKFDAVLCANDYAAVSLIKHLNDISENPNDLAIISYSNTAISRYLTPSLSTVVNNNFAFGKAAFAIKDCVEKNPEFTELHIGVECEIIQRDTTNLKNSEKTNLPISELKIVESKFYNDTELLEIMGIDKLLETCDKTDFKILQMFSDGKHTKDIIEECFISESALKYRINKMKQICNKTTKSELLSLLKNYKIIDNL